MQTLLCKDTVRTYAPVSLEGLIKVELWAQEVGQMERAASPGRSIIESMFACLLVCLRAACGCVCVCVCLVDREKLFLRKYDTVFFFICEQVVLCARLPTRDAFFLSSLLRGRTRG